MNFTEKFAVPPGKKVRLADYNPEEAAGFKGMRKAKDDLEKTIARLDDLQELLYAEKRWAVVVVLQAMDSGGKDGTVRHVMSGLNPQACKATAFKAPSAEEQVHDFLWRVHKVVPARGEVGIFNRSHYEDVLVVRVHRLVRKSVWSKRYEQINLFEKLLSENRVRVLKFFLHISKSEQKKRFLERVRDPRKQWKLSPADFEERRCWNDYMRAYEDAISRCNTAEAPWFIVPSNKKWFRDLVVSRILVEALENLKMKYPQPSFDVARFRWK